MKKIFIVVVILFSMKSFACKCAEMNLTESFKHAEFVIIGNVFDIFQTPNGYSNFNNILNTINIKKIYKSTYEEDFPTKKTTLFSTPVNCLDFKYSVNEDYIIFGYTEPDTGFIYSDNCTYTRKLSELSKQDLEVLENLKSEYWKNTPKLKSIDKLDALYSNFPNVPIKRLRRDSELTNEKYQKLIPKGS